jgi:seryl-tRNA synthetase
VASGEQRARDSDARLILQSELKKAQARQEELQREYNNGEPEKRGDESRNHQKYLDRVAELKASLARNESDVAGIRRELDRLPAGNASASR